MITLSTYAFRITALDLTEGINFETTNFEFGSSGSFSHSAFWTDFQSRHVVTSEDELMEIICDVARSNFSPNRTNWPGCTIKITGKSSGGDVVKNVILEKGKSKVAEYHRGKGKKWSHTQACLATAGIFQEIFRKNGPGEVACKLIVGNYNGYTQFCGTIKGWSVEDQGASEAAFAAWITATGLEPRDVKVEALIKAAARTTISNRNPGNCALGFKNVCRFLTGVDTVVTDDPTMR